MLRTALALALNWGANVVHFRVTGEYTPWLWYLPIDAITAWIVLVRPAGKMQSLIGLTFLIACALHVSYGVSTMQAFSYSAQLRYYWWLTTLAALQVALTGGWSVVGPNKRSIHRWFSVVRRQTDSAYRARLD